MWNQGHWPGNLQHEIIELQSKNKIQSKCDNLPLLELYKL